VSGRRSISRNALLAAALFFGARLPAQAPADEAQIKAIFVYNFLKFVEWPAAAFRESADTFVVAIIGKGSTAEATERFLAQKRIGDRAVAVRRLKWDQPLAGVHAAFVTEGDATKRNFVLESAATAGVLSIGEGEKFASEGGMIGLLIENRKVRFDIDTGAAQSAGLRVSSKLLALTRVVHSAPTVPGVRR
jgi:hypothetical protein